eukprot:CAMPEP_0182418358 /NCGR_PEP_ID=MMETSP1167-20130531/2809_1 /TAXON_ID=2988 /ORGANISM="Mallomonas Sp, Strain CCMP3275" /LENGTH=438 /DNA_ID=CAMNT_0024592527 /DNA_START=115 /DNA_END=1431 /DNA_ORIENTATION=+
MSKESDVLLKNHEFNNHHKLKDLGDIKAHFTLGNPSYFKRVCLVYRTTGAVIVFILTVAGLFSQQVSLRTSKSSVQRSLTALLDVHPGDLVKLDDELWPESHIAYDKFSAPFKMVFHKGDIFLFAKARSKSPEVWGSLFEDLIKNNEDPSTIGWGEPYWKLSEDPVIKSRFSPEFTPEEIMANGVTNFIYRVNIRNQPQIVFQKAKVVNGKSVYEDLSVYTGKANFWGCNEIKFKLSVNGDLQLYPYSTRGGRNCESSLPFASGSYTDLGGTTRVPTLEPSYGPGMPTPEPTSVPTLKPTRRPSSIPSLTPTSSAPTGVPTVKAIINNENDKDKNKKRRKGKRKKGGKKKRNRKRRKNRKRKKRRKRRNKNKKKPTSVSELEEEEYIKEEEIETEDVQDKEEEERERDEKDYLNNGTESEDMYEEYYGLLGRAVLIVV